MSNIYSGLANLIPVVTNRLGYQIIPKWRLENLEITTHLAKLFDHFGITTVFDVGANVGQYHDFLRQQVGFSGKIHSFEPQPQLADALRKRQGSDSAWEIHNLGLGSTNGELMLNIMARDTFSSFRQPAANAAAQFAASNTVIDSVKVPVRRLDDLFPVVDLKDQACYLKIDTQGFDLEVLRGASELLKVTKALQFELAVQQLYTDALPYQEMLATVEAMGFFLSGMFPVSMDDNLRAVEFDCVMVRSEVSA